MVGPDCDFLHPALDQHLVKFRQLGGLAADEILKLRDATDLLVPCDGINGGLMLQLSEPEYLIGNLVVGFLVVDLLQKVLLQFQQLFINGIRRGYGTAYDVWRCRTKTTGRADQCPARTIKADDLEKAIMEAFQELFGSKDTVLPILLESYQEALAEDRNEKLIEVSRKLEDQQHELISSSGLMDDILGEQIDRLREEKRVLYAETASDAETLDDIRMLQSFLEDEEIVSAYDEQLVRDLISKVIVYDDKILIQFKAGLEAEIDV